MPFRRPSSLQSQSSDKKCIVVTGASSGIGDATLRIFAQNGYKSIGIARRGALLQKTAQHLQSLGLDCEWYECDLANYDATTNLAQQILSEHGCPYGVVFNAGLSSNKLFRENDPSDRQNELTLNYLSPTWMLDVFLPEAQKKKRGHFLVIGSLAACTSFPGNATYAASKAAIAALWQSLEHEYNRYGISFSTVLPGIIETEMSKEMNPWIPRRSARSVAELVLKTFHKPGMAITNGIENQAILAMTRLFPETTQSVITQIQSLITPTRTKS